MCFENTWVGTMEGNCCQKSMFQSNKEIFKLNRNKRA